MRYMAFIFLLGCIMGTSIGTTHKQRIDLESKEVVEVYKFNVTYINGVPLISNPRLTYGETEKALICLNGSHGQQTLQQLYLGSIQTLVIEGNLYWLIPIKDIERRHLSGFMLVKYTDYRQQDSLVTLSDKVGQYFKQGSL